MLWSVRRPSLPFAALRRVTLLAAPLVVLTAGCTASTFSGLGDDLTEPDGMPFPDTATGDADIFDSTDEVPAQETSIPDVADAEPDADAIVDDADAADGSDADGAIEDAPSDVLADVPSDVRSDVLDAADEGVDAPVDAPVDTGVDAHDGAVAETSPADVGADVAADAADTNDAATAADTFVGDDTAAPPDAAPDAPIDAVATDATFGDTTDDDGGAPDSTFGDAVTDGGPPMPDAPPDAPPPMDAPDDDTGLVSTPGEVRCNSDLCSGDACCANLGFTGWTAQCGGTICEQSFGCDEIADCSGGDICCTNTDLFGNVNGSSCQTVSGCGSHRQLCTTDAECPSGKSCKAYAPPSGLKELGDCE